MVKALKLINDLVHFAKKPYAKDHLDEAVQKLLQMCCQRDEYIKLDKCFGKAMFALSHYNSKYPDDPTAREVMNTLYKMAGWDCTFEEIMEALEISVVEGEGKTKPIGFLNHEG